MGVVAFDARSVREVHTGLGRVAGNLIRNLARLDDENEYLLIQRTTVKEPIVADPRFHVVHFPYDIASLRNAFYFGRILNRYRPSIYHSLHDFLPFWVPKTVKTVVTVHDFNWIQRPSIAAPVPWKGWVNSLYGRPMYAYTVCGADHIVCISHQTKRDLFHLYPDTQKPVSVIYNGVAPEGFDSGEVSPNIRRYGRRRFILSVGHGRPYKNPEGTLRAFARIKREPKHADIRLLVVGRGDTRSRLQACARANGIGGDADFLGLVSDAELAFLFRHALLLSFPSLWEGFGLPVIEAFAFGCPVIASNVASLKETATGAAWMINDPSANAEIAQAMRAIINDPSVRERLRRAGRKRAKRFKWERAAHAYLAVYKQLMEERATEKDALSIEKYIWGHAVEKSSLRALRTYS